MNKVKQIPLVNGMHGKVLSSHQIKLKYKFG